MSEVTISKLNFNDCANCHHTFLSPIGTERNKINQYNDEVKQLYRKRMHDCNRRSRSSKSSTEPKMGKCLSRKLAYLCYRMYFSNSRRWSGMPKI